MAAAASGTEHPKCGAKTRRGTACQRPAGFGTDHVGYGHCKNHGGSSPGGQIFAAKQEAAALALEYQIEPHEALLRAVGQAAKWELICRLKVQALSDDELVRVRTVETVWSDEDGHGEKTMTASTAELNIWLRAHTQAIRDLASIAKTALDAGVEERRVRVAEHFAADLSELFGRIFAELQLTDEQRQAAPTIVRRHLIALEGGQSA